MESIEIQVEHHEGDEVFFKVDQEKKWMVTGIVIRGTQVKYLVSTPEIGEVDAFDYELTVDRDIY